MAGAQCAIALTWALAGSWAGSHTHSHSHSHISDNWDPRTLNPTRNEQTFSACRKGQRVAPVAPPADFQPDPPFSSMVAAALLLSWFLPLVLLLVCCLFLTCFQQVSFCAHCWEGCDWGVSVVILSSSVRVYVCVTAVPSSHPSSPHTQH